MKTIPMFIVMAVFLNFGNVVFAQNKITIVQGSGVVLNHDGPEGNCQWQSSDDAVKWIDIPNAQSDVYLVKPGKNSYFRARLTNEQCKYYSEITQVVVKPKPQIIDYFNISSQSKKTVLKCIWSNYRKDFLVTSEETFHYTLSWTSIDQDVAGIIISRDEMFIPEDGVNYGVSYPRVIYIGPPTGSWYVDQMFDSWVQVFLYVYTYTHDLVYSESKNLIVTVRRRQLTEGYSPFCQPH